MSTITAKQERFCLEIVKGQTQSEAYRIAFQPKGWKAATIHVRSSELAANSKVQVRIAELRAPVVIATQLSLHERLQELKCAAQLDPADAFDVHGRPLSIREMPEHVRRAIAGYEVDPLSYVTKVKFVDKRGAIMDYSKLAGDIPNGDAPPRPPTPLQYDHTKLTAAEWEEYKRIKRKALVGPVDARSEQS